MSENTEISRKSASSSEPLIKVDGVSKKFCRRLKRSLYYGAKDILGELLGHSKKLELRKDEFWAVRDISFELRRGECLGLIGHNGAGKSTLLKILNGIIKPDQGTIDMYGRVSALIELGAGFNPILTGRENIYNKGAILGFSNAEIDDKFDEIVEFSEIGDFIDTPVQNYSSGMKVRLGFAVSAQMDPDILIVDEVLAVGDLGFTIKCLNRISEILPNCAVIFVSHSMPMVGRTCTHALLMDHGKEEYLGTDIAHAIERYIHKFSAIGRANQGSGDIEVSRVGLSGALEGPFVEDGSHTHTNGDRLHVRVELNIDADDIGEFRVVLLILDQQLREIVSCTPEDRDATFSPARDGSNPVLEVSLPNLYLNRGLHTITIVASDPVTKKMYCRTTNATSFMAQSHVQSWATCVMPCDWRRVEAGVWSPVRS